MKPLQDITILDLTRLLPGAVTSMMLGDFGAEVIKIEEPGIGDPMRYSQFGVNQPDAYFLAINRNKRSVTINLKEPAGREVFLRLAEKADVVLEGFRPGVMDRLGIGYEALRQRNPRVIFCSISGFGQDGPYRDRAGHDANYISIAGLLGVNGPKDGPPVLPGVQIADIAGGSLHAVIGILLALQARERTGEGQAIDISMTDCSLSMMYIPLAQYLSNRRQPVRGAEGLTGRYACYQVYETSDGRYLSLGALEPKFWINTCRVFGREDLIPLQYDNQRQEELTEIVAGIFRTRAAAEWLAAFEEVDTCVALIKDLSEMLEDPQIRHRGLIAEIEHPEKGSITQIAPVIRLSATPATMELPPPRLGEHTREVLAKAGYSGQQIEELIQSRVVATMPES